MRFEPSTYFKTNATPFGISVGANQLKTLAMTDLNASTPETAPAPVRERRDHLTGFVILGSVAIAVVLAVLTLFARNTESLILGVFATLSVLGVFFLFSAAVGLIRFGERGLPSDIIRAYADQLSDGLQVTTKDGDVIYTNGAFRTLLSSRSLDGGLTLTQAFAGHGELAAELNRLTEAANSGQAWVETVTVRGPDGMARRYRLGVRHILQRGFGYSGLRMLAWSVCDVTEMEADAAESSVQLLAPAASGVGSVLVGHDGRIVSLNPVLGDWLGIDAASVAQNTVMLQQIMSADALANLSRASNAVDGEVHFSGDLLTADGQAQPVHAVFRWLDAEAKLVSNGASWSASFVKAASGEDVSENAKAAEARFARLFHAAPIAIATLDAKGRIGSANGAFAALFAQPGRGQATPGMTLLSRIDKAVREDVKVAMDAAITGESGIAPVEFKVGGKNGAQGLLYVSPVTGVSGGKEAALVYAVDRTKQKELEEQFAQAQKMQAVGQLAGGMAHDFNNVLTTVMLSSDFLLSNHRPGDPAFKDIMAIKQNAGRAAGIVKNLLAFSRQQTLRPEVLSLTEILSDWWVWLSRSLGEQVQCKVHHGRDLWTVKADKTQLEQVIMNLAVNARDAMPDGGSLNIRTSNVSDRDSRGREGGVLPVGEYVMCEVSDSGCGMSPETVEKVFLPFFSTKDVGKGTGLGLSTVYGIVKQTGGFIFIDSVIGKGTTFRIYLPRHIADETQVAAEPEIKLPTGENEKDSDLTGSGTVLLVEDEDAVRGFAARALTSRGYNVLEAGSGVEALEVIGAHSGGVDLVVSDVVMPEMDGPTLLRELRKLGMQTKVIFMSGHAEDAFKKNLDADESFAFLPKPFSLKQLAATVKQTIG